MNDRLVLGAGEDNLLALKEAIEVLPVVELFVELEAVIELVHLEVLRVVAAEDFGIEPTVGEVALWVSDLVGQVE